jgi:hypothetical protein
LVFKRWKSLGNLSIDGEHDALRAECELYGKLVGVVLIDWLVLQRGGALSGVSPWRGWQIVHELLPQIVWALAGRSDEQHVWIELDIRLAHRPRQPKRRRSPSTRQRLFDAALAD